ncbi:MAG TPA: hypothetical protein VK203_20510 [Nostocaceae cyanobacterium]|nr:hypothetical protein [Nostocaceae cyanobacterium]
MEQQTQEKVEFTGLPLAVYREIAAHLQQVVGVEVELIPQTSSEFDYYQSQTGGLSIRWTPQSGRESRQRVQQILAYYQNRYKI